MQRLKIEDQIQLAHILEQSIQRLDIHLYQIDQRQRALGARADDDEVEGRVVAVGDQRGNVVVWGGGVGGVRVRC